MQGKYKEDVPEILPSDMEEAKGSFTIINIYESVQRVR